MNRFINFVLHVVGVIVMLGLGYLFALAFISNS
jgi:hypothetical protein